MPRIGAPTPRMFAPAAATGAPTPWQQLHQLQQQLQQLLQQQQQQQQQLLLPQQQLQPPLPQQQQLLQLLLQLLLSELPRTPPEGAKSLEFIDFASFFYEKK